MKIDDDAFRTQCCPFSVDLHLAVALLAIGCDYYLLVIFMLVIDEYFYCREALDMAIDRIEREFSVVSIEQ